MRKETELLEQVIHAMQHEGLPIVIEDYDLNPKDINLDGTLKIIGVNKPVKIELVKWATNKNIGVLINKAKLLGKDGILIADYINPNLARRLKEEGIQFLDVCGNAYINNKKHFIYVKGNKATNGLHTQTEHTTGKMYNATGLKVIFAILYDENLIDQSYRIIAVQAGVALGNITKIFTELKAQGFLVEFKGKRKLIDKERLFQKWVEYYPNKLRDKLFLGEFLAPTPAWWKNVKIEKFHGVWGGEVGAANLTNYLKSQDTIVYLPKLEKFNLVKEAELKKTRGHAGTQQNLVKLFEPFWRVEDTDEYAPELLIYADLIATGDSRNIEVADLIYKEHIVGHLK